VSPERHFEIIASGRQLAGLVALVVLSLLAAFGLGVWVGLLEPSPPAGEAFGESAWRIPESPTVQADQSLVPVGTPPPTPAAADLGVLPPVLPSDIAAVPTVTPTAAPRPGSLTPAAEVATPAAVPPTRRPVRPTPRATATPRPTAPPQFWIQVGALSRPEQAEGVRQRVMALGFRADQVRVLAGTGGKYRIRLGPFPDQESAGRVVARLHDSGFPDAFHLRE